MANIFISYASEDRDRAELLAKAFEDKGWSVWWDRNLPFGRPFDEVIRTELRTAGCVVALWTENSAKSLYVIGEARDALSLNKLISVFLSRAELPYDLQGIQGVELFDWHGDTSNAEYQRLVRGITAILDVSPHKAKTQSEQMAIEEAKKKPDTKTKRQEEGHENKEARSKNEAEEKEYKRKEKETGPRDEEERNLSTTKQWCAELVKKRWWKRLIRLHLSRETHVIEINGRRGFRVHYALDGEVPLKVCKWPTEIHVSDGGIQRTVIIYARFPNEASIMVDRKLLYYESLDEHFAKNR